MSEHDILYVSGGLRVKPSPRYLCNSDEKSISADLIRHIRSWSLLSPSTKQLSLNFERDDQTALASDWTTTKEDFLKAVIQVIAKQPPQFQRAFYNEVLKEYIGEHKVEQKVHRERG